MWDAVNGDLLSSLAEHKTMVNTICWAPNGTRFFSGDGAVKYRF